VSRWLADGSPVGEPFLGPLERRSEAMEAEMERLEANWLIKGDHSPFEIP
jgi:hypothetical protein